MVVEEKVQAVLAADGGVLATVAADHIKAPGSWQEISRPYVVHFPVSVHPTHTHDGLIGLREWPMYQVSCFGDTYSQAKGVAEAVRAALGQYKGADGTVIFWRGERYLGLEADVMVHHIALEFEVWEAL